MSGEDIALGMFVMGLTFWFIGFRMGMGEGRMRMREHLRVYGMRTYVPGDATK